MRWLFLTHRYLGIGVSLLMVCWCLSGIVMMYVSFPTLPEAKRVLNLAPLDLTHCCRVSRTQTGSIAEPAYFDVEMLAGKLVAHLMTMNGQSSTIDLADDAVIPRVSESQAVTVANRFAQAHGLPALLSVETVDNDQWITSGDFDGVRPYYKFCWSDADRSCLYVSTSTGKAMQFTTASLRFWNWLGAVPHWIYFSTLRHNPEVWAQVITWTSIIGCFQASTGIYIGVRQFLRRPSRRWSPYRGFMAWHHIPGLLFGVFVLTWLLSGLFSVTPWGFLEGGSAEPEQARMRGTSLSWPNVRAHLSDLRQSSSLREVVALRSSPFNGKLYFIAVKSDGTRVRLDGAGIPSRLSEADLRREADLLNNGAAASPEYVTQGDSFYFDHHSASVLLPVYRVIANDDQQTRYYLDPVSGDIVRKVDRSARGYRWLHEALHRLDFSAATRSRPFWDSVMLLLMTGVTLVCVSGCYFGVLRVTGRTRASRRKVLT